MSKTNFTKDSQANKMSVKREFNAPVEKVWFAWTQAALLDQWWAPKPWKTKTKSMDFREGGMWLYSMESPDGSRHWGRADYTKIEPGKSFAGMDSFCDENGVVNKDLPATIWTVSFEPSGDSTVVNVELAFASKEDMDKMTQMGFEEGFSMAQENLDALLEKEL
jgi:uncharacterized protein YndB with AHSA1/START domain